MRFFLSCSLLIVFGLILSTTARPESPSLWLYYTTNLQSNKNVDELDRIWRRAAAAGYSYVLLTDSKFARLGDLGDMTKTYMNNVDRVKKIAAALKLEIVPALFNVGYSNSLLWHDPNLAEGLPRIIRVVNPDHTAEFTRLRIHGQRETIRIGVGKGVPPERHQDQH